MTPEQGSKLEVIVIGAGIAGLTAAHELIERGFAVTVIERDRDWESDENGFACAVGGMAKSQWSSLPAQAPVAAQRRKPASASALQPYGPSGMPRAIRPLRFDRDVRPKEEDAAAKALITEARHVGGPVQVRLRGEAERRKRFQKKLERGYPHFSFESKNGAGLHVSAGDPGQEFSKILPGEHGFRFFPGFYRHVFDTMQRTPLGHPEQGGVNPYHNPVRSTYDNLVPTRESGLGLTGRSRNYALEYPREAPRSIREVLDTLQSFMEGGGYSARDIARFSLKLFQYMTSSNARRRAEFENISWWDFIEGESFEEPMRHDLDVAPAVLGALVSRKSDARTQGSVSVQLLLDQLGYSPRTDALLNGPTTDAWFKPWREYLEYRGVKFEHGELVDFEHAGERILPVIEGAGVRATRRADFYVLATALPDLTGRPPHEDPGGPLQPGLAHKFLEQAKALRIKAEHVKDFLCLSEMNTGNWNKTEDSLLQHLIGIQYFFEYNDRQFTTGHSVYLDSEWRLSAISQTRFWRRPPGQMDGFDGILSVDIGDVWRETELPKWATAPVSDRSVACWGSTPLQIAEGALGQIKAASPDNDPLPWPICYHLDQGLTFDAQGKLIGNATPYLVNRPGEWRRRPGRLDEFTSEQLKRPPGERTPRGYEPQAGNWFLCGTFMRTHTRLTTMEAANESARHAVNGILALCRDTQSTMSMLDPCQIWDIEEHEAPDLRWLKELDEKLFAANHPHWIEILSLDRLPEALLPVLRHVYEPLRELMRDAGIQGAGERAAE